jgi:hypothetical protein
MSLVYFSASQSCEGFWHPADGELSAMISKEQGPPVSLRTRAILAARGLTLSEVARRSRSLFPDDNRFHIPPNLYHTLQHRGFSPSVQQLLVLSRLSGYRLVDWLAIFGVVLDDIPRLQAILPARYTTLIDENVYDDQSWILSFEPIAQGPPGGSLRPLGEWLRLGAPRRHAARASRCGRVPTDLVDHGIHRSPPARTFCSIAQNRTEGRFTELSGKFGGF